MALLRYYCTCGNMAVCFFSVARKQSSSSCYVLELSGHGHEYYVLLSNIYLVLQNEAIVTLL